MKSVVKLWTVLMIIVMCGPCVVWQMGTSISEALAVIFLHEGRVQLNLHLMIFDLFFF